MLKTYLDWNIIADLRDNRLSISLENFLEKYRIHSLFPYSNVHFQDLYNRGKRDESKIQTDLGIIDEIAKTFYLAYDEKEDKVITQYGSAFEYYEHYKAEGLVFTLLETFIDTLGNLILTKGYIRKGQEILGLDPKIVNNEKDVIEYFNSVLPNTEFKKGFFDFIEFTYKEYFNKEKLTTHDYFVSAYLNLHILGFQTEKLPFKNILNDASHLFFGSACDYFITHDKKLLKKARILFEVFSIECKILTFEEFLVDSDKHMLIKNVDFLESIGANEWKLNLFEKLEIEGIGKPIYRKSLQPKLFGLFNEVKIIKSKNHHIYIFMVEKKFHEFFYYGYDFKTLIEWLIHFFGDDDDGLGVYNEDDQKMVENKFWNGRNWSFFSKYIVNLKFYGKLILQIAVYNNCALEED
ncbi:MAG: hypothetical protein KTR26_06785 [Flammeovirgaceae bacterium]|nr:hypothetical protein [Flammeovirgaceae bacterium]